MPNYRYQCPNETCHGWQCDGYAPIAERDLPRNCELCGGLLMRIMTAPSIMQASLPDGSRRRGFADAKEVYRLEHEKMKARGSRTEQRYIDRQISGFQKPPSPH